MQYNATDTRNFWWWHAICVFGWPRFSIKPCPMMSEPCIRNSVFPVHPISLYILVERKRQPYPWLQLRNRALLCHPLRDITLLNMILQLAPICPCSQKRDQLWVWCQVTPSRWDISTCEAGRGWSKSRPPVCKTWVTALCHPRKNYDKVNDSRDFWPLRARVAFYSDHWPRKRSFRNPQEHIVLREYSHEIYQTHED